MTTNYQDRDYVRVKHTPEEFAEWRKRHNYAPPHRVACKKCGKRYWLSGLAVGSHRRACRPLVDGAHVRWDHGPADVCSKTHDGVVVRIAKGYVEIKEDSTGRKLQPSSSELTVIP
jgi:hypothetical protein